MIARMFSGNFRAVQAAPCLAHMSTSVTKTHKRMRIKLPDRASLKPPGYELREIRHCVRNLRGHPEKFNRMARIVRGLSIDDALFQLRFSKKLKANKVMHCIQDAVERFEDLHGLSAQHLYVAEAIVGKGPYLKRVSMHARGRAGIKHKPFAHFTVVLREDPASPQFGIAGSPALVSSLGAEPALLGT